MFFTVKISNQKAMEYIIRLTGETKGQQWEEAIETLILAGGAKLFSDDEKR